MLGYDLQDSLVLNFEKQLINKKKTTRYINKHLAMIVKLLNLQSFN
jgi:hypothetical protein